MKPTVRRTLSIVLCGLSLLSFGNSRAQTNSPTLQVTAYICRGPDITGRGPVPAYRVTVAVTNTGDVDISFQKVEAMFIPALRGALTGSAETTPSNESPEDSAASDKTNQTPANSQVPMDLNQIKPN